MKKRRNTRYECIMLWQEKHVELVCFTLVLPCEELLAVRVIYSRSTTLIPHTHTGFRFRQAHHEQKRKAMAHHAPNMEDEAEVRQWVEANPGRVNEMLED